MGTHSDSDCDTMLMKSPKLVSPDTRRSHLAGRVLSNEANEGGSELRMSRTRSLGLLGVILSGVALWIGILVAIWGFVSAIH